MPRERPDQAAALGARFGDLVAVDGDLDGHQGDGCVVAHRATGGDDRGRVDLGHATVTGEKVSHGGAPGIEACGRAATRPGGGPDLGGRWVGGRRGFAAGGPGSSGGPSCRRPGRIGTPSGRALAISLVRVDEEIVM